MKTMIMVMMVAGGLAMQAMAAGTDNGPSADTQKQPNTWQPFYKLLNSKTAPNYKIERAGNISSRTWQPFYKLLNSKTPANYKIERYGNISSRPWAQIAGEPAPAAFFDQRVHEAHFNLFWFGATPD